MKGFSEIVPVGFYNTDVVWNINRFASVIPKISRPLCGGEKSRDNTYVTIRKAKISSVFVFSFFSSYDTRENRPAARAQRFGRPGTDRLTNAAGEISREFQKDVVTRCGLKTRLNSSKTPFKQQRPTRAWSVSSKGFWQFLSSVRAKNYVVKSKRPPRLATIAGSVDKLFKKLLSTSRTFALSSIGRHKSQKTANPYKHWTFSLNPSQQLCTSC